MSHPVPAAIDALLVLFRGAPALAGVRVDDGPPVADMDEREALGVGLDVVDAPTVEATSRYGYATHELQFDVKCLLQVWSGSPGELPALRARAYELFDVVVALLALNRDLGGAVDWARLARHGYRPVEDEDGALALIEFTVRVDAHRFEGV